MLTLASGGTPKSKAVKVEPSAIYRENIKSVVSDGQVSKEDLCTGVFAAECTEIGL